MIYMKSRKLLLITLLFLLNTIEALSNEDFSVDGKCYQYISQSDCTVRIGWMTVSADGNSTSYGLAIPSNTQGKVIIPSTVVYDSKSYTVVEIAPFAFSGCTNITEVVIPETVTDMGNQAFKGCTSLVNINIPCKSIGSSAFENCTSLKNVKVSNSLNSIGESAFYRCFSLDSFYFPDSLVTIGKSAFAGCIFKKVEIPNSVTQMKRAFYHCTTLEYVILGENVGNISEAFEDCWSLKRVYSRSENPTNSSYCFDRSTSYVTLYVPIGSTSNYLSKTGWKEIPQSRIVEIGNPVFATIEQGDDSYDAEFLLNTDENGSVQLGLGLEGAFWDNISGFIDIPTYIMDNYNHKYMVTRIGNNAFSECSGMTTLRIPKSVRHIDNAFLGCSNLNTLIMESRNPLDITVNSNCFDDIPDNAVLYVPAGTKNLYCQIDVWDKFSQIIEVGPISAGDISAKFGTRADLPIILNSEDTIMGIQFKLTLPLGVSVVDENGLLVSSLTDRSVGMTMIGRKDPDAINSYLFVLFSLEGKAISGNKDAIASIRLSMSKQMEVGIYDIILEDVYMTSNQFLTISPTECISEITIKDMILGDVNNDNDIDIADVIGVVNYILKNPSETFILGSADINMDGDIDIADVIGVVNIILRNTSSPSQLSSLRQLPSNVIFNMLDPE